jgi:uncharacterized protein YlxW (UPF0749 family)
MSDPYTDQAAALAALSSENGVLRAEVARLRAERDDWRDTAEAAGKIAELKDREIERLLAQLDDGPTVTDMLHELRAEIEQLTAALQMCRDMASINLKMALDRKAEIERLHVGIAHIVGMCLGDVGIGKIHAAACALFAGEEGR